MQGLKTRVTPTGIKLLLYGVIALTAINILQRLSVVNITGLQPDVITVLACLFVAVEIGVMSAVRGRKKLDAISIFGAVVVSIALISLVFGWFGVVLSFLTPFKAFVEVALLIFVIIEIFR